MVGILGASTIAAARWMGWKVPVIAARLLTPAAVVLGIHHRFLIAALVTLTWIDQRLKRWPKFALSSIATVISAVIVALVTARSVRRLLLDAAVIAGAFPWMKAQKLERLALGLMISAVVTVFVGVPLLLVTRKLAKPWRILAKVSLLTIAVTFSAAALTIVPGVAGAIILFLSVATFLSMVATHPRVLLAPLAALLTVASGLVLAGAVAFLAAGTPVRAGRRLFRRLRVAGLVAAAPILVWAVLILSAALLIVTVASISHAFRTVDLIFSIAVFAAVVGLLGIVLGSLALTLFNRVTGVVIAGIVTVTFIAVAGLIVMLGLVPIYLRVVNTIAFPLVGIPLDIFNLLTRHSPLGRLLRLWVVAHLAVLAVVSLGLVTVVIILNIAGTLTGFVAVSGIAITIVLAYLYVFIPIVAVLILAYFAIAAGLGWLLASFGP
jgi:putative membrane protein